MTGIPQRISLVTQTAAYLRVEIEKGVWGEWLPGERVLCESLQVSRNTLRAALAQLKRDRVIRSIHGSGNQIAANRLHRSSQMRSHDVAVLTPEPLERLRPMQTLWIDNLRAMLSERSCRLHVFYGRQYFRTNPGPALAKLTQQSPHGCWVLMLSNETTQRWFEQNDVPCIVAGSVYPGIDLPFRDLDHRALCRHAVGALLALGHRSIAMLMAESQLAGDFESEAGFREAVNASSFEGVRGVVERHRGTPTDLGNSLRRLLEQKQAPTAFIVANAYHYLTVASTLAQLGRKVPQDVSLISRDEDPFLAFMRPVPTHYVLPPRAFAKALMRPVAEYLDGGAPSQRKLSLTPNFVPGGSTTSI